MKTAHQVFFSNAGDAGAMEALPPASVDLMVTSPPYPMIEMWDPIFAGLDPRVGKALDQDDGAGAFDLMHQLLDRVWRQVDGILAPGAIACINIGDATRSLQGRFSLFPNHARIITTFQEMGYSVLPAILWRKPTNAPNKFMGSGMLPPNAYVTLEHEYILIFRKRGRRHFQDPQAKARRYASAYFWEERNAWYSDIWFDLLGRQQSMSDQGSRLRSGAFPLELPLRLTHMFSVKNDMVLDPFLGTGTTMLAAMATGRNSIGFEIDQGLQALILQRVAAVPEISRKVFCQRLAAHCDFVRSKLAEGKSFKHRNAVYDLPVVTKQETLIQLELATQIQYHAENRFSVSYHATDKRSLADHMAASGVADSSIKVTGEQPKIRQLKLF